MSIAKVAAAFRSIFGRSSQPAPAPAPEIKAPEIKAPEPQQVPKVPAIDDSPVTGAVSAKYESGSRGVRTVSTGKGDHGGVSYGKHQLASNTGTMDKFLNSQYGAPFVKYFFDGSKRVPAGTSEFNKRYLNVCANHEAAFEKAQFDFIYATHYKPQAAKLNSSGGHKIESRGRAVRELVYGTAVQYGPSTSVILNSGVSVNDTDEDFIRKVQSYKRDTVDLYFKSSSEDVRKGIKSRITNEMNDLLALSRKGSTIA